MLDDLELGVEHVRLVNLLLKDSADDHCEGSGSEIKDVVNVLRPGVPLHFCRFFDSASQLLQSTVIKLVELLHVAPISLELAQRQFELQVVGNIVINFSTLQRCLPNFVLLSLLLVRRLDQVLLYVRHFTLSLFQ